MADTTDEDSTVRTEERPADDPPTVLADAASAARDGVIGAAAGAAGIAAMTAVLLVASAFDAFDVGSIAGLGAVVGFGESPLVGYAILSIGATTAWPLLFAALGDRLPGRSTPLRGVSFATVIWTGFVAAFYTGQSGSALAWYALATLVAHWAYGLVLGAAFDVFARRVADFPSTARRSSDGS